MAPHSTGSSTTSNLRTPSLNRTSTMKAFVEDDMMEKFPDFSNSIASSSLGRTVSPQRPTGLANGSTAGVNLDEKWLPRKDMMHSARWGSSAHGHGYDGQSKGHSRQKSLGDALHHIRTRKGSVSQNAHEIADALKAPVSPRLIGLCLIWYWSSALTNTSSKSILTAFDKPATLTIVQFAFVSTYCLTLSWLASVFPRLKVTIPALKNPIRYPSRDVILTTLPLAAFQIGGHLLSSTAMSKIPVSMVHTIKGLSPLFTVFAYRFVYDIRYPMATYLSLIPLTLGVMLACSGSKTWGGQLLGVLYALLATIIFVTQNIFSKRLFNEAARAEAEGLGAKSRKLDKLNLLCYSSGMAFLITAPIWFWSEGVGILGDFLYDGSVDLSEEPNSFDHGRLVVEFIFNGTFHFAQNILAFVLLSMVSPVTYSVASLIKRVFVIVIAIMWFRQPTTKVQAVGILLTFFGLYLYDRSNESNKADRRARSMTETRRDAPLLPLNTQGAASMMAQNNTNLFESPAPIVGNPHPYTNGYSVPNEDDTKKTDGPARGRASGNSDAVWMPPGTKQEETWQLGDRVPGTG